MGENGYVIDIPTDWGIHPTFNIEDLVAYKGSITLPLNPPYKPTVERDHTIPESTPNPYREPSTRTYGTDNVKSILDDQVTVTRGDNYQRYLVHWAGRPDGDNILASPSESK